MSSKGKDELVGRKYEANKRVWESQKLNQVQRVLLSKRKEKKIRIKFNLEWIRRLQAQVEYIYRSKFQFHNLLLYGLLNSLLHSFTSYLAWWFLSIFRWVDIWIPCMLCVSYWTVIHEKLTSYFGEALLECKIITSAHRIACAKLVADCKNSGR